MSQQSGLLPLSAAGEHAYYQLAWSPTGAMIAAMAPGLNGRRGFVRVYDGRNGFKLCGERRLPTEEPYVSLGWLGQDRLIVSEPSPPSGHPCVTIMNAQCRVVRTLRAAWPSVQPSPAGTELAYVDFSLAAQRFHVVRPDGSHNVALPACRVGVPRGQVYWSPDGRRFAFAAGYGASGGQIGRLVEVLSSAAGADEPRVVLKHSGSAVSDVDELDLDVGWLDVTHVLVGVARTPLSLELSYLHDLAQQIGRGCVPGGNDAPKVREPVPHLSVLAVDVRAPGRGAQTLLTGLPGPNGYLEWLGYGWLGYLSHQDGTFVLADVKKRTWSERRIEGTLPDGVLDPAISPDRKHVAVLDADGKLTVLGWRR